MNGAKEANDGIKFNQLLEKLDRIIFLLELLTNGNNETTIQIPDPLPDYYFGEVG